MLKLKIEKSYNESSDFMVAHRHGEFLSIDDAVTFMERAIVYFGHDQFEVVREHDVKVTPRKGWFGRLFGLKDRKVGCVRLTAEHLTGWGLAEKYAKEQI